MIPEASARAKARIFTKAMSLNPDLVRRLAGRPKRIDGLTLSPQTQLMLRMQKLSLERAVESLPIPQGRIAMRRHAQIVGGDQPIGEVENRTVRGAAGPLDARLYVPTGLVERGFDSAVVEEASAASRLETTLRDGRSAPSSGTAAADPMLVFYHGGGMIYGDLDSHDAMCRFLAEQAGVRVLAVDYRLGPEAPFPAGVEDAWTAYEWISANASDYGADPHRLAVGGDSAGGYLAATTAIRAAHEGRPLAFQLLIYPVTDMEGKSESRAKFGRNHYLTHEFMEKATENYLKGHDPRDPRASVIHAEIPPNLAPAFVTTAGFDPLRDEGEAYAEKLADAGVDVAMKRYGGEIHGFANMVGFEGHPKRAMTEMAHALAEALDAAPARPGAGH